MYKKERKNEGGEAFLYFSHGRPARIWLQRRFLILFSISDDWPSTLHVLYQMTHEGGQCFNAEPITERENADPFFLFQSCLSLLMWVRFKRAT